MKNSVIYIIGATVLVGGAYLFLKNKKAKDLAELDKLGGTTPSGTTPSGTTPSGTTSGGTTSGGATPPLSTTSDGVSPSDANINLANANNLASVIKAIDIEFNTPFKGQKTISWNSFDTKEYSDYKRMIRTYSIRRNEKVSELAKLGYKVDAIGNLVKI